MGSYFIEVRVDHTHFAFIKHGINADHLLHVRAFSSAPNSHLLFAFWILLLLNTNRVLW